jgi:hypothetical protein
MAQQDSPYFAGGFTGFGPPSGLAALIAQSRDSAKNFDFGGVARFADVAEKYKRTQDAGKAADYFMKAGGDQAYAALGIHPEQWKTLGAREKSAAVAGMIQANAEKSVLQKFAAEADAQAARKNFTGTFNAAAGPDPNAVALQKAAPGMAGLSPALSAGVQGFANVAAQQPRPVGGDQIMQMAIQAGMAPEDISHLAQASHFAARDPSEQLNARANMLNAEANFSRAAGTAKDTTLPADLPRVPGYMPVPDGRGGFKYLKTQPSATAEVEMSRLRNRRDSLKTQVALYDQEIASGNKKPGVDWLGSGKTYAAMKADAQRQMEEIDARLTDLASGGTGVEPARSAAMPSAAPAKPAPGASLWDLYQQQKR